MTRGEARRGGEGRGGLVRSKQEIRGHSVGFVVLEKVASVVGKIPAGPA